MIKIFSDHKLLLAAYLILAPLNAITSISFSLSLTPLIGAATQLDGSLFVQAVLACLCIAPASAVDADVTLRVGLTISGASTFANPQLENVSGEPAGYAIGTMAG
mgnify:CR=1 FL=1